MKDNKLIAEFMGVGKLHEAQSSNQWNQYHTSWDWLMPVVEKIFALSVADENIELFYDVQTHIPDKTATYNAVVEFINNTKTTI
jgi:hypothetical protein